MTKNNGGYAPQNAGNKECRVYPELGMTLRDYFAANAEGFAEETSKEFASKVTGIPVPLSGDFIALNDFWFKANAKVKYMQADAMIAARGGAQ